MGSTRSWWLTALDDRLKTAVCVACMTRYQDLIRAGSLKEHGIYYFVPGMLRHFDTEAVIACAAPRPILFMTGDRDPGSPFAGIHALEARLAPLFNREGGPQGLRQPCLHRHRPCLPAGDVGPDDELDGANPALGVGEGGGARGRPTSEGERFRDR